MPQDEIVFDIETKKAFAEVGGKFDFASLGVSIIGLYSYAEDSYLTFDETSLDQFVLRLKNARRVIGYNIKHFDYQVLQGHVSEFSFKSLPTLDLMEETAKALGFRPKLNDLAKGTLGVEKSGRGMDAIRWYQEGKIEEIKKYCLDDVRLTKDLFEFGVSHGYLMIEQGIARTLLRIPVSWQKLVEEKAVQHSLF
ncbi:MAG: ribonuclease H-like domain-containing protein [Candidatus Sungbacteria bacterium]|uniref:Ribonuclease H-like domain-containing protein n=1 Tax=Candidatus Sungiibacteriota bacterium TaxID=2750080 RepID=A0A9D6LNM3_9BACT|nr:ribonuclease H-like domain-containing protein [Candidatus Sungbacteria bacterium]